MADAEVLEPIREALTRAPLTKLRAKQLAAGLDYLQRGQDHLAVPLLINPIEGIFWTMAADRGVVVLNQRGKWESTGSGELIHGLERALDLLGGDLDEAF